MRPPPSQPFEPVPITLTKDAAQPCGPPLLRAGLHAARKDPYYLLSFERVSPLVHESYPFSNPGCYILFFLPRNRMGHNSVVVVKIGLTRGEQGWAGLGGKMHREMDGELRVCVCFAEWWVW